MERGPLVSLYKTANNHSIRRARDDDSFNLDMAEIKVNLDMNTDDILKDLRKQLAGTAVISLRLNT